MTKIWWIQQDLRLADNPALSAAAHGSAVIPLYIWHQESRTNSGIGGASRWWLHGSLHTLSKGLRALGSSLILRSGPVEGALASIVRETRASEVHWTRSYPPVVNCQNPKARALLDALGVRAVEHEGNLLLPPESMQNSSGQPYLVFSSFWHKCVEVLNDLSEPIARPRKLMSPSRWPASMDMDELGLLPEAQWAGEIAAIWTPGEIPARGRLVDFVEDCLSGYPRNRDFPDLDATSRLSPYLHFGEISPRQVWHAVRAWQAKSHSQKAKIAADAFLRELGWREFAHHLLHHFPQTQSQPLQAAFARLPWSRSDRLLRLWQKGKTGYPIVDAGMRQLWRTGWMHNRVRMIVASFLVKHLLVRWQQGAAWFMDTLVDADVANNTLNWQWVAGCGANAAPFFRIFNPVRQGTKFDREGNYIRRFVPELARLPAKWIHAPWQAPGDVLAQAGVRLGEDYPRPIVDHAEARERALAAFASIRRKRGTA